MHFTIQTLFVRLKPSHIKSQICLQVSLGQLGPSGCLADLKRAFKTGWGEWTRLNPLAILQYISHAV